MVRVGGTPPEVVEAAITSLSKKKDKKKGKKKSKSEVDGAQGADKIQDPSVSKQPLMDITPEEGRAVKMSKGEMAKKFPGAVFTQEMIDVATEREGLPARVRTMKNDVEYAMGKMARDDQRTMVVRVEDMMELFAWMGYPPEARKLG